MVYLSVVKMSVYEMARCPSVTIDGTTFTPRPYYLSQINNKLAPSAAQKENNLFYQLAKLSISFHDQKVEL